MGIRSVGLRALLAGSSAAALLSTSAAAQDFGTSAPPHPAPDGPGASAAAPQSAGAGTVGEVVVTAQKREQAINKVGAPIVALGSEALQAKQVVSLADLANAIPGLNFANTGFATPVYTLRGVGFYDSTLSAYPAVTVYLDQVPLPFPALSSLQNFDLARIEVLEGPQGTLFGSNATGGAINYVAAKPTTSDSAGASLSYGRFNNILVDGYLSGPITQDLRGRVAVRYNTSDDWQHSYTRNDTIGDTNTFAGRILLDWDPTSRMSVEFDLNGWTDKSSPQQPQLSGFSIQYPGFAPAYELNYPLAPHNARAADWDPALRPRSQNSLWQATARVQYKITDDIQLTSLSSYLESRRDTFAGGGAVNFENSDYGSDGHFQDIYQELRLDNGGHGATRWTAGLNYQEDKVNETDPLFYGGNTAFYALGISHNIDVDNVNTKNYAVFGNIEQDVFDRFTLKAGLRYTETDRDVHACNADDGDGAVAALFTYLEAVTHPGVTLPPVGVHDCFTLNPATFLHGPYINHLHENNLSYRVGVDWRASDTLLFYVNVARGYKAGGFPSVDASTWAQYGPLRQEELLDYEGGFKAQLFDRLIQFSGNAFYYDYTNKQLRAKVHDPVFGDLDATVNIPKSSITGGELELSTRPIHGFTGSLSATYLDGTIDKYTGLNNAGVAADFAGTRMPYASKLSINADVEYRWDINDNITGFVGGSLIYRSKTNAVVGETPSYEIPSYTLLDLRVGVQSRGGNWKAMLWGKNVTNQYYINNVVQQYDLIARFAGLPVTYGVTLSRQF